MSWTSSIVEVGQQIVGLGEMHKFFCPVRLDFPLFVFDICSIGFCRVNTPIEYVKVSGQMLNITASSKCGAIGLLTLDRRFVHMTNERDIKEIENADDNTKVLGAKEWTSYPKLQLVNH
jgi:hypothetical protein